MTRPLIEMIGAVRTPASLVVFAAIWHTGQRQPAAVYGMGDGFFECLKHIAMMTREAETRMASAKAAVHNRLMVQAHEGRN